MIKWAVFRPCPFRICVWRSISIYFALTQLQHFWTLKFRKLHHSAVMQPVKQIIWVISWYCNNPIWNLVSYYSINTIDMCLPALLVGIFMPEEHLCGFKMISINMTEFQRPCSFWLAVSWWNPPHKIPLFTICDKKEKQTSYLVIFGKTISTMSPFLSLVWFLVITVP